MVIKLEYSLRLKIKRNDWLLADTDTCPQAANHCALFQFESENELKFYNLEARGCEFDPGLIPYFSGD